MSICESHGSRSRKSRAVGTLKDGYWDRTEVIGLPDGSRRVRKQSKGAGFGPWGVNSLRREIRYLTSLPERDRSLFPPVLATWDDEAGAATDVGYEMPFYADHVDAGELARRGELPQNEIDEFQDALAEAVLERLHEPVTAEESLAAHVTSVVEQAWAELRKDSVLAPFLHPEIIELNGERALGPRAAFERIRNDTGTLTALDTGPVLRLHGDLFLENILWRPAAEEASPTADVPRLILIDPVSVAGVTRGPPVFDLVKYVSYATGELLALRSELVEVDGFGAPGSAPAVPGFRYRIRWEDPALKPFRTLNWHRRFQRAFEARHGAVDRRLHQLIDGYFSAAMAVNTGGVQRRARLLKATAAFNAVLRQS
jgi:Phosphotransferase enzyme family